MWRSLSPYIEEQILKLVGKHALAIKVSGKLDGKVPASGENSSNLVADILSEFLGTEKLVRGYDGSDAPSLPMRPPVLVRRLSASRIVLCSEAGDEGKESVFLWRYRMLYTRKCDAA